VEYSYQGQPLESFPANGKILSNVEVKYISMPGWKKSTYGKTAYYDLPQNARDYIEFIEKFVGVKCKYIGTGPNREHLILRTESAAA
jgi:adenylosuccinate synthase